MIYVKKVAKITKGEGKIRMEKNAGIKREQTGKLSG